MDKSLLRNFATYSRTKLIDDIKSKAHLLGITDNAIKKPLFQSADMVTFDIGSSEPYQIQGIEKVNQYKKLVQELKSREKNTNYETAYSTLIEEVAYTWFNRIIAIRFMEINNYLPDRMRVLSSGRQGLDEPEFVTHYDQTTLVFTDKEEEELQNLKLDGSVISMDQVFQSLFVKECNRLNDYLPELFEKIDDYMELLLTISYIDEDGVVYKLVHDISEKYFNLESENGYGQIELIGWLYQYYNSELKAKVDSDVKKGQKVSKDTLPAKTQLFTPNWIVRYMVENSLGRLWIEKLLTSGDNRTEEKIAKDFNWDYYIPEADQDPYVKEELKSLRESRKNLKLEEISFIDPAMGSFHIGVYAFDIFMQFYESQGYTQRDAAKLIIENNLYGIDIDKRAYQLSYFALIMKARQYNRGILTEDKNINLYYIIESNDINREHLNYFGNNMDNDSKTKALEEVEYLLNTFQDAREIGSILKVDKLDWGNLYEFIIDIDVVEQVSIESQGLDNTKMRLMRLIELGKTLSNKYHIVVTNPPYLSSDSINNKLKKYLAYEYPDSKSDLFAVFIEKSKELTKQEKYYSLITQHAWMFLTSYEKLRLKQQENMLLNMIHLGPRAFEEIGGEVVQSTSFVFKKIKIGDFIGSYIRLIDFPNAEQKEIKALEAIENPKCRYYYETSQNNFEKIPGMPVAYWVSKAVITSFNNEKTINDISDFTGSQNITSNNDKYLRYFWEVLNFKIGKNKNWAYYAKGGYYRRWYGNVEYVVNITDKAIEFYKQNSTSNYLDIKYWYTKGITYSAVTSKGTGFRYFPAIGGFDKGGATICYIRDLSYVLAVLNSKVSLLIFEILNPTINLQVRDVKSLPIIIVEDKLLQVKNLVKYNIINSKTDWDTFETSWDFKVSPLVNFPIYMDNYYNSLVEIDIEEERKSFSISNMEDAYNYYKEFTNSQFDKLKANEEELNRIFIEIYGLEDELDPYVSDRDITIAKIFDSKKEKDLDKDIGNNRYALTKDDVVKQFISYGVGCIMGRYSLDIEGLAYAGGEWDDSKYESFKPVEDNIVLITDRSYFDDDLTSRFIKFVEKVYGKDSLEDNLDFIAKALGGRGNSRDIIRKYFLDKFFTDHVSTYKKRPIYWLYDAGAGKTKRNNQDSFKALIYMHRYDEDTTGKVRIDYLHEMQKAYERRMDNLNYDIANNENARQIASSEKELERIEKQLKEVKDYDEKIGHLALSRISIDLDDGVKVNYEEVQTDKDNNKLDILAKI